MSLSNALSLKRLDIPSLAVRSGGRTPYLGPVSTRAFLPNQRDTNTKQIMARVRHRATDNISSLKLVFANFFVNTSSAEQGSGGTLTVTAAIEYPVGTYTQVKFSGSTSAVVADAARVLSDFVSVSIPSGAYFWTRTYAVYSVAALSHGFSGYSSVYDGINGEALEYAASGLTDRTMGGTITNNNTGLSNGGGYWYGPSAVLGYTRRPSFALIGDSRCVGEKDSYSTDIYGDAGEIARSIGQSYGYMNLARGSCLASVVAAGSSTHRRALADYATHVICELGGADLRAGDSAATVLGNLSTIWALFPTKRVYQSTITPFTNSTDSWATTANQSDQTGNTARATLNDSLRAVPSGIVACLEVADQVETARNSGRWKNPVSGGATYTTDGVHGNSTACVAIRDSGAISVGAFA